MNRRRVGRLDAHQHFWSYDPAEYGWISENMVAIRQDFLPNDLRAASESSGITGSIAVQARQSLRETCALLGMAEDDDFVRAVVGWAPLLDPHVDGILEGFAAQPKLRGVRHVLQDEPDPEYMLRDDFNFGISTLKRLGLVYDILIYERHLPQAIQFVDRHPDQIFVLDHVAKPRAAARELSPWRERFTELARRPNVYCKLSGLVTEADHQSWKESDLMPYMEVALEAFGPKRLMFGSDWPVLLLAATYQQWVSIVEVLVGRLSKDEQERIWHDTVQEAYGLGSGESSSAL
jgi:L-fuconolactonase